ncbi:MAG: hypothetical protein ACJ746_10975 [Bryobacteraceae bacterium]
MIYTTPHGISVVDLQTFKNRSVVEGEVRVTVAGAKSSNVYYIKVAERAVCHEGRYQRDSQVASLPPRNQIGLATVNAHETLASGTHIEADGNLARQLQSSK